MERKTRAAWSVVSPKTEAMAAGPQNELFPRMTCSFRLKRGLRSRCHVLP